MEAARQLDAPDAGATPSNAPILPQAHARPAPAFERRQVEIVSVPKPQEHRTSLRGYLFVFLGLVAVSVGGWFAFAEYIYG